MTTNRSRVVIALALCAATAACVPGVEIAVGLQPGGDGQLVTLVNRSPQTWSNVRVRVTGDAGPGTCFDQVLPSWKQGEAKSFPRCGDRTLLSITVGGEQADFVHVNGKLYRKLGRREVPVAD